MYQNAGHYNIEAHGSIGILKSDVQSNFDNTSWTFRTSAGSRIRFRFHDFGFYWSSEFISYLEIGDGLSPGLSSRLAHFRGLTVPSDVLSVSHSAWMKVYHPVLDRITPFPRIVPKAGPKCVG